MDVRLMKVVSAIGGAGLLTQVPRRPELNAAK